MALVSKKYIHEVKNKRCHSAQFLGKHDERVESCNGNMTCDKYKTT